jgi:hypothetical protein
MARRSQRDAHRGQLTVDPAITPGSVLPRQVEDDGDGADGNARSPRAVGIGPPTPDQVSVPTEQRLGLDEEPSPMPAVKKPAQSGEQRPIWWSKCRADDLATQNGQLVAEHDDLDCQFVTVTPQEPDQLEDPDERQVEEGQRHGPASSLYSHRRTFS